MLLMTLLSTEPTLLRSQVFANDDERDRRNGRVVTMLWRTRGGLNEGSIRILSGNGSGDTARACLELSMTA